MRVTVANLDHVACEGVAHNVALSIDREDFSISCYGIDLGVFNLVLGIDFLRTLGPFCGTSRNSFGLAGGVGSCNDVQQPVVCTSPRHHNSHYCYSSTG
jgi:hypothetical protein